MSSKIEEQIAELRESLEAEWEAFQTSFNAKKEALDNLEKAFVQPKPQAPIIKRPAEVPVAILPTIPVPEKPVARPTRAVDAVHQILSKTPNLTTGEIAARAQFLNVRTTPTKSLTRVIAGAVFSLKERGRIETDAEGRHRLRPNI